MASLCLYCGGELPPPPPSRRGGPRKHCSLRCAKKHGKEREIERLSARAQTDRARERPCARSCGRFVVPSFAPVGARPTVCAACCEERVRVKHQRRRALEALPTTPLTPGQQRVLETIEAGAARLPEIAERTGLSPSSVASYAALLARRGVVARPAPGLYARAA
jgi:DNA-binding CsgD family transcriptional regulator